MAFVSAALLAARSPTLDDNTLEFAFIRVVLRAQLFSLGFAYVFLLKLLFACWLQNVSTFVAAPVFLVLF